MVKVIAESIKKYLNGEKNKELELTLVNHPKTPKEVLEQIASSSDSEIAEAANLHVNLAGEIEERWYELAENIISQKDLGQDDLLIYELLEFAPVPDYFINEWMPWKQIAKGIENPHMPSLWRDRLLNRLLHNVPKARQWIAAFEHTPIDILKQLAVSSDVEIRNIVSLQPSFSPEWFDPIRLELKNDSKPLVDFGWFQWFDYPSTDITKNAILKLAAKNGSFEIRKLVLRYGYACPDELFEILAIDTEVEIRKGVAESWSTNDCVRDKLAQDKNEEVRKAVASCQYTPKYIRQRLAKDSSEVVRQAVKDNKYFLGEKYLLNSAIILKQIKDQSHLIKSIKIDRNFKNNTKLQLELLKQLADDITPETSEYRSQLAAAVDTPTYILEKLINSSEVKIRYRLAKRNDLRWDLSDRLWEELVIDPEKDKIYNERSRQHNLNYIPVNLAEEPEALPFIIKYYAESSNNFSRFITLSSTLLLPYLFTKYVRSKSWLDRYALAQNPATPKKIQDILTKDANRIVRAAAKHNKSISQSANKTFIPKNKIDNHNLLATLTVITKQAARDRLGNDWHQKLQQKTILWEVENKNDLCFANFLLYHGILKPISIDKFIQGFQKQASHQYKGKKLCSPLIEPPVTEKSINQCQYLINFLQNNLKFLQPYQINFKQHNNIFQIIIGKTQHDEWIGISTSITTPYIKDWESGSFQQKLGSANPKTLLLRQNIESIISNLTPSVRFMEREFAKGLVVEIAKSRHLLIERLLILSGFIENTEANVIKFLHLHLSNFQAYQIGYCFSGVSYYYETYTIGETSQRDWLILNSQIYSYP